MPQGAQLSKQSHRYLDMPTLSELSEALLKRKAPVKAVLLNQNGPLCGIGNWLVSRMKDST